MDFFDEDFQDMQFLQKQLGHASVEYIGFPVLLPPAKPCKELSRNIDICSVISRLYGK